MLKLLRNQIPPGPVGLRPPNCQKSVKSEVVESSLFGTKGQR